MKIDPKLMTDAELADFALTVERAFESQSLAGLEMNYDAMANAGPAVLGHIAALTAERDAAREATEHAVQAEWEKWRNNVNTSTNGWAEMRRDRNAHSARCIELQRQLTEMEESRDGYRAALARHEERVVGQIVAYLRCRQVGKAAWTVAQIASDLSAGLWRMDAT